MLGCLSVCGAGNPDFLRAHMEEGYYPSLDIFHCDPTVKPPTIRAF